MGVEIDCWSMTQNIDIKKDNTDKIRLHKTLKAFVPQIYHTEWGKEDLHWRYNSLKTYTPRNVVMAVM